MNRSNGRKNLQISRLLFSAAVLCTLVLLVMGVTGAHWPKWLLALTTVF